MLLLWPVLNSFLYYFFTDESKVLKVFKADKKAKEVQKFNESTNKLYSANNLNLGKPKDIVLNKSVEIDTNLQG